MDKCGICLKPAVQLFETGKDGIYACFKCQPLVPEITIGENGSDQTVPQTSSNTEEEGNESSLYCGLCHKSFQKNMQLQNHLRNHRAERRFVCTYCNKAFSQSNNLRAHLRIHTNERPFKCSECGKAFTQVTNLNNHVRLHTGERPFVCPEPGCNKAYAQVTNLNQHRKRHLNGRPVEATYDCTVCGEQFQQRNHMYMHRGRRGPAPAAVPAARAVTHATPRAPNEHRAPPAARAVTHATPPAQGTAPQGNEHTEHLLRHHQLRVLSHTPHPAQGTAPKMMKDPLEIKEEDYHEVKIRKSSQPQYLPKLKVQSLFQ
ncbi:hypothetical protein HF086_005208 [Spodoptera exigua]|uniref:C2H2-type domain-containing protein n=1 Tax=Spodoptera exigua TaxID=7107 RepID=A0A922SSK8_SPOEX|nr:hypothetical protein HF086_005208 [Spodoptera exigua]